MLFVGDVAIAQDDKIKFHNLPKIFTIDKLCINLEGPITSIENNNIIYNSSTLINSFDQFKLGPVCLANNHITDLTNGIESTIEYFSKNSIPTFGAGINSFQSSRPLHYGEYILLAFGWHVIGCKESNENSPGCNKINPVSVIRQVVKLRNLFPSKKIICIFHWNFEFELYPQPMFRQMSIDLIDVGCHSIIGNHPHIVSPIENYKGHLIAYSLGNWSFSYKKFVNRSLQFPNSSFRQIAIEIKNNEYFVHYFKFKPDSNVFYEFSESFQSTYFKLKPLFEGFSNEQYIDWFKKHRVKKSLLPIYIDYRQTRLNKLRDIYMTIRSHLIALLVNVGLKSQKRSG
tara:strand:- start:547 stop:1575 length:1029 start_codon:yes stop_codon:yes gene_type:complete